MAHPKNVMEIFIFFDQTADDNLDIGPVLSLGAGLARMFGKLAFRHGFDETRLSR